MSHSNAEIAVRVREVINEVLRVPGEKLAGAARFKEDLGADSLDTVTLLMALEEAFGGSISDEEARELATVDDVIAYIARRSVAEKQPS